jgi:putative spermidine/putrescine transport system permease protein
MTERPNPSIAGYAVVRNFLRPRRGGETSGPQHSLATRVISWVVLIGVGLYFFIPLLATFLHSIKPVINGVPDPTLAYRTILGLPSFYGGLIYSFVIGLLTIFFSLLIIVPTAYWVRLRAPRLRPIVEFVTLLPFVVPPIVYVFGLIRTYGGPPFPLLETNLGSDAVLVAAYVILSFPYMYRAVDTGLAAIDVRALTEASQSLGAGWARIILRVIFPNLRTAILAGAFLTLAIVVGEFTIAIYLARNQAFGPWISLLGRTQPYTPAVVTLISFALTWLAMRVIAYLGRSSRTRIQVAGAR